MVDRPVISVFLLHSTSTIEAAPTKIMNLLGGRHWSKGSWLTVEAVWKRDMECR